MWSSRTKRPTPEELLPLVDTADLREKTIVSMLSLAGLRKGTLTLLQYRHVKDDLEAGKTPLHIHIPAELTKGKYHDYDTFLGTRRASNTSVSSWTIGAEAPPTARSHLRRFRKPHR